ncbi:ABC transporter ATP-binding protein [Thauera butanivorans]|uniref:ABC transporter ATP-binding protein n=1 Tax=Thauera butanivorans TaxID=86174 RepID=UPI003AB5D560
MTRQASASPQAGLPPLPGGGPAERPHGPGSTLRRLWACAGGQRPALLAACALTLCGTGLALLGPWLIGRIIDQHVVPRDGDGLARACAVLLLVYLAATAMNWLQSFIMIGVSQRTVGVLRQHFFAALQDLPLSVFARRSQGDLMSRATNDVEMVALFLNQALPQLMSSVVLLSGSLLVMLWMSPPMTLLALLAVPLAIVVTRQVAGRTRRHFSAQQGRLGELNGFIEETLSGQKVVQAYRREAGALREFDAINSQVRTASTRAQILAGMMGPSMNATNNLGFAVMAAIGAWLAIDGATSIGVVVAFLNYTRQIERPINDLANQFNLAQSALAGAERVLDIIDEPSEHAAGERTRLDRVRGEVSFEGVGFGYQAERPVLRDIDLHVQPGQMIALVGPTGAGKSTLASLLTRFHDADSGTLRIDGHDIRTLDKNGLRRHFGMVLQDTHLFSASVRDNIRFGRDDASAEEVERAAVLARADGFIRSLPQGYDTLLAENGARLSQGQRQLLAIARALLADPAILILDEATSNIDTRTEALLRQAMDALLEGRTSFVIAHRLSTIAAADRIVVMDGGRIVESGTHRALLRRAGLYRTLYQSQFSHARPD